MQTKTSDNPVQNPEQVREDMRKLRDLLRMNRDEFSTLIGLSRHVLHDYENGKQEWSEERVESGMLKLRVYLNDIQGLQWDVFGAINHRNIVTRKQAA